MAGQDSVPDTDGPPLAWSPPGVGLAHWLLGSVSLLGLPGLMAAWSKAYRNAHSVHAAVFQTHFQEALAIALAFGLAWTLLVLALDRRVLRRMWAWDVAAAAGAAVLVHLVVGPPTADFSWTAFGVGLALLAAALGAGIAALAAWRKGPVHRGLRSALLHAYGAFSLAGGLWLAAFAAWR